MANRILLVDDESEFVELLQYRLARQGYEFVVASSGLEALNKARQSLPDLILLDILLPDLDGLSVCEILRHQPSTGAIPVILMSALRGDVTRRATAAHADDFFTKPLNLAKLEERITDLLKRGTARLSALNDHEEPPE